MAAWRRGSGRRGGGAMLIAGLILGCVVVAYAVGHWMGYWHGRIAELQDPVARG